MAAARTSRRARAAEGAEFDQLNRLDDAARDRGGQTQAAERRRLLEEVFACGKYASCHAH